jgi:hypothetical protein
MGLLWRPDLSISFLSRRIGKKKRGTQKTEIHSMTKAVNLKDLPDSQG